MDAKRKLIEAYLTVIKYYKPEIARGFERKLSEPGVSIDNIIRAVSIYVLPHSAPVEVPYVEPDVKSSQSPSEVPILGEPAQAMVIVPVPDLVFEFVYRRGDRLFGCHQGRMIPIVLEQRASIAGGAPNVPIHTRPESELYIHAYAYIVTYHIPSAKTRTMAICERARQKIAAAPHDDPTGALTADQRAIVESNRISGIIDQFTKEMRGVLAQSEILT